MFSGTDKWENAARHFKSAGNFYKAAMKCELIGRTSYVNLAATEL